MRHSRCPSGVQPLVEPPSVGWAPCPGRGKPPWAEAPNALWLWTLVFGLGVGAGVPSINEVSQPCHRQGFFTSQVSFSRWAPTCMGQPTPEMVFFPCHPALLCPAPARCSGKTDVRPLRISVRMYQATLRTATDAGQCSRHWWAGLQDQNKPREAGFLGA